MLILHKHNLAHLVNGEGKLIVEILVTLQCASAIIKLHSIKSGDL